MANLKQKVKSSKSKGSLGKAAKKRQASKTKLTNDPMKEVDPNAKKPQVQSQPFNASTPLPPTLAYIRKFATIPGLRKEQ